MVETWVLLALIYPFFYVLANVMDKFLLEKRIKNCFSQVFVISIISLLAALITAFFVPFNDVSAKTIIIGFSAGLVYSLGYYLYFYTISFEEVSRFISVINITPLFVLLFAVLFLGESLPVWKYFAIFSTALGAFLIGVDKFELKPIMRVGFWLALLSCLFWGGANILQKYVLSSASFWNAFALQQLGLSAGLFCSILLRDTRVHLRNAFRNMHFIFLSECFNFLALLLFLLALSKKEVSLVSAMSSLQPLYLLIIMLLISTFVPKLLKEVFTKETLVIKIVSVFMIVVGVFLISL